jgi:hypothetical protein
VSTVLSKSHQPSEDRPSILRTRWGAFVHNNLPNRYLGRLLCVYVTTSKLLIPLSLIVLPVVSSAVFLSVRPSFIAVGFGSSFQLLSRGFSFRYDGGEGGRGKMEKEEEETGKHALLIKLQA